MAFSTLQLEQKNSYTIITMDNGKVNAINTELIKELGDAFRMLDKDESNNGILLTGRPHCFSAGLDVYSLAAGGVEGGKVFWKHYLETLQAMVRYSKPFVCGITGYAPAGATVLAICADYRIMGKGEKHVIGMNEFKMNLLIPEMLADIFAYGMGEKEAWKAVQKIKLFNSDEALAIGLVDESVAVEEVLPTAEKQMERFGRIHPPIYQKTKSYLRKGLLKIVDRDVQKMIDEIILNMEDPFTQQMLQFFLASMSGK